MTAVYAEHGLTFSYPENWTLEEENTTDSIVVTLQSPKGAIWAVSIFSSEAEPEDVAKNALQAMLEEYPDLEVKPAEGSFEGIPQVGFDIDFVCLDFIVTASLRAMLLEDCTVCIECQAETREFDQLAEVFRAITYSMLENEISHSDN